MKILIKICKNYFKEIEGNKNFLFTRIDYKKQTTIGGKNK